MAIEFEKNYKTISVKISDGSVVKGKINLTNYPRVSDMLKNSTEKFITVVSDQENPETKKVYIINKEFMVWAEVEG
jgi:hypothetical protein